MISEAFTDVYINNQIELTNNIKIKFVCFFSIVLLKHQNLATFAEYIILSHTFKDLDRIYHRHLIIKCISKYYFSYEKYSL